MDKYLPGIQDMTDLHNAVIIVLVILVTGIGGTSATIFAILKWYLPNQFKHRDDSRQLEIDNLRTELETKRATEAVDLEKERMLPMAFQSNQHLVDAMIKSKEADTAATLQRIELDKTTAAVLLANTKQITTHSDQLEENTSELKEVKDAVNKVNDAIADMKTVLPTLARKSEMDLLIGRVDDVIHNLEELKRDCLQKKHKTGELPTITADKATILLHGVEPDDLPKAG